MLVTLASFREPQEAYMLRGRLRAEGIVSVVSFAYHVGNNWPIATALGGAKLQVRRGDYEAARSVLSLCQSGEYKRRLQSEIGDLDDTRCPNCGAADYWKRRPLPQAALAIAFTFLVVLLPPWRWLYFCNVCGTKFRSQYRLIGKAVGLRFSMAFEKADLRDFPEMQDFFDFVSANSVRRAQNRADLIPSERRPAWVCRIDGMLAGFSLADLDAQALVALCVHPDFERNGIGRRLHNRAVHWLFAEGVPTVSATAAPYTQRTEVSQCRRMEARRHRTRWRLPAGAGTGSPGPPAEEILGFGAARPALTGSGRVFAPTGKRG